MLYALHVSVQYVCTVGVLSVSTHTFWDISVCAVTVASHVLGLKHILTRPTFCIVH